MAEFSKLLVTDKGSALVMKVLQGIGAIHFTRLAASSRKYQEEYIKELVSLEDIKQHGDISEIDTEDSSSVLLKVVLPNTDLTEGYYIRTIGLYANDPEEGEILYGVSMETSAGGCYVPPYNHQIVSSLYFQVSVAVGNAENVSLEVDAGAVATRRQLDAVQQRITDEVVALHESIERKVEGTTFDSYKNSTDIVLGNTDIAGIGDGTVTGAIRELNTGIKGIVGLHGTFMHPEYSDITDCNDLPIGYCGYTYSTTRNAPDAYILVQCLGASNNYKLQIAVGTEKFWHRYCIDGIWRKWVKAQNV